MKLNACKVRRLMPDGTTQTLYVYGPTAQEYVAVMGQLDGLAWKLLGVETAHGYKEEEGRRRKSWWEREAPPDRYYFNKYLSREPISGGAGPYVVGTSDTSGGQEGSGDGRVEDVGSGTHDGDAT